MKGLCQDGGRKSRVLGVSQFWIKLCFNLNLSNKTKLGKKNWKEVPMCCYLIEYLNSINSLFTLWLYKYYHIFYNVMPDLTKTGYNQHSCFNEYHYSTSGSWRWTSLQVLRGDQRYRRGFHGQDYADARPHSLCAIQ